MVLTIIPLLAFTCIVLTNHFTGILFSINDQNKYSRGGGIWLHWIVTWGYLLVPTYKAVRRLLHEKNKMRRQEYVPLLYFVIAPLITSALQIFCYGITTIQVGITISIIMVFLSVQNGQVLTDSLTGLNNRRGLNHFLETQLQHKPDAELTFLMLDINNFKSINDKYGHMTGDYALQSVAHALKQLCQDISEKLFICRYGGDEFVIVGVSLDEKTVDKIKIMIRDCLNERTGANEEPYSLSVSIGAAKGLCTDINDIEHLLRVADEAMYDEKKNSVALV